MRDDRTGLTPEEATRRLEAQGPNELPEPKRDAFLPRLGRHLAEPMAILLVVAAAVSGLGLGHRLEGVAILAIVALNAVIGLVQEGRAERALAALRRMETPHARVRRGGAEAVVPAREVVPGDVVLLAAGDRVPADLRLLETASLEVDESVLTGESLPVPKDATRPPQAGVGLAERPWMAYSGTLVTRGAAVAEVVETGPRTEFGSIAATLAGRSQDTPLQVELRALTTRLGAIAVAVAVAVFGLTLLRTGAGEAGLQQAFLSAVALAVAAVPEGLATVVTVSLALGVRRMAAHGAIVRRLPAVETLGATTLILTDKTGTLTQNRMRLEAVVVPGAQEAMAADLPADAGERVMQIAVLCSDATLDPPVGDPLEVALLEAAGSERVDRLRRAIPRVGWIPFEAKRRRMVTVHREGDGALLLVKGAPETILQRSARVVRSDGQLAPLDEDERVRLTEAAESLAARGARVIALARRSLPAPPEDPATEDHDLDLVGLVGLRDPVRPEAAGAVAEAAAAGIRIVMVTGDHPGTAAAIAAETGLAPADSLLRTGEELRRGVVPSDPSSVAVFARVEPEQKLDLVDAARAAGEIVAVTGDGVNDAPALKRAHIGVAMGRSGSEVAREAADMVVTDDNLATIVTAIREGRGIYDNIRKVIDYLVAGNLSEIAVVVGALLLFPELGVPLLPLQLLWVNLLTDGLPAIALGADPADAGLMRRPPRRPQDRLLRGRRLTRLFARGLMIAAAALGSLAVARFAWGEPWEHARAVMFTVLVSAHILYAFVARLPTRGLPPWLLAGVVGGLVLQALVVLWPPAQELFGTAPLAPREWGLVLAGGTLPVIAMAALTGRAHA